MLNRMRKFALGAAAAAALLVIPISAFSQSIESDREASEWVDNATNCGVPAKTRTG